MFSKIHYNNISTSTHIACSLCCLHRIESILQLPGQYVTLHWLRCLARFTIIIYITHQRIACSLIHHYVSLHHTEVCINYTHGFCSSLPGYGSLTEGSTSLVYVNRLEVGPSPLHYLEYNMKSLYDKVIKDETSWSQGCDFALKQLICHTTLPFCSKYVGGEDD